MCHIPPPQILIAYYVIQKATTAPPPKSYKPQIKTNSGALVSVLDARDAMTVKMWFLLSSCLLLVVNEPLNSHDTLGKIKQKHFMKLQRKWEGSSRKDTLASEIFTRSWRDLF